MASRHTEVSEALITRLMTNLPTGITSNRVKFPNAKFTTPQNQPWIRPTVTMGRGINVQAGGHGRYRTEGIFVVDVFTPAGTGDRVGNNIAVSIDNLFRKQFFDKIRAYETQVDTLGVSDAWFQTQVSVFFNFDACD